MTMANPYNYKKPTGIVGKMTMPQNGKNSKSIVPKKQQKTNGYLEQEIMTAKPEKLTLMLYDGVIKFIKQAKVFNDQGNTEKSSEANMRAQKIINELRATLDTSIELSKNLDALYVFMNERLFEANLLKDNTILDEVLDLAEDLRDTWKEAMKL